LRLHEALLAQQPRQKLVAAQLTDLLVVLILLDQKEQIFGQSCRVRADSEGLTSAKTPALFFSSARSASYPGCQRFRDSRV